MAHAETQRRGETASRKVREGCKGGRVGEMARTETRRHGETEFFRQDLQDLQDSGTGEGEKGGTQRHGETAAAQRKNASGGSTARSRPLTTACGGFARGLDVGAGGGGGANAAGSRIPRHDGGGLGVPPFAGEAKIVYCTGGRKLYYTRARKTRHARVFSRRFSP